MRYGRLLLTSVFITGAAVLVVEITATRILAAYFGSTIYTVSSVLSVILAALSAGYLLGGRLADRRPHTALFFRLILLAGLATLLLHLGSVTVLPTLAKELDLILGPLVASAILFTIPSLILGMLSPFAISLRSSREHAPGQAAGTVFAVSTFGSITGSLLAGFLLIPLLGLKLIIIGTAGVLLALGLIGLIMVGHRGEAARHGLLGLAMLVVTSLLPAPVAAEGKILWQKDGRYERLTVYETAYNGRPARVLAQDQNPSSAIFLHSSELAFEYTKYAELMTLLKPNPGRALVIGGGAYTVPRYLLDSQPGISVDVSETEPALYGVSKEYFGLRDHPNLHNYIVDGRRFISGKSGTYDVMYGDAYSSGFTVPQHLMTVEFFRQTRESLTHGGVFMANIVGALRPETPSFMRSAMATFNVAYPNSFFVAVQNPHDPTLQNVMFVGLNTDTPPDLTRLSHTVIGRLAEQKRIHTDELRLSGEPVFTDDFAPVEYLLAQDLAERR